MTDLGLQKMNGVYRFLKYKSNMSTGYFKTWKYTNFNVSNVVIQLSFSGIMYVSKYIL